MRNDVEVILASASPRRAELLRQLGVGFRTVVSPVPEPARKPAGMPLELWPTALAFIKAFAVQKALAACGDGQTTIVGADTIVVLDGRIMNKPRNRTHARQMLERLSGRRHEVITGLTLLAGERHRFSRAVSVCRMKKLSVRQVERYLDTGLWRGKAGAYGIQDEDPFVTLLEGEFSNVVGLPLKLLAAELESLWVTDKVKR